MRLEEKGREGAAEGDSRHGAPRGSVQSNLSVHSAALPRAQSPGGLVANLGDPDFWAYVDSPPKHFSVTWGGGNQGEDGREKSQGKAAPPEDKARWGASGGLSLRRLVKRSPRGPCPRVQCPDLTLYWT